MSFSPIQTRDCVAIALFAALFVAASLMPPIALPFVPVPITASTTVVMLAGALLGAKRAFLAIAVVWLLIIIGLPVLPGGRSGLAPFFAPTSGYLLGFGAGALAIGWLFPRQPHSAIWRQALALFLGGIVVVQLCGIIWLSFFMHISFWNAFVANLVFVAVDLVKLVIVLWVIRILRRALPQAFL